MLNKCNNPILAGFYPDPSVCRVGDDFYLVNSTFAYFPGVPIFHSKDLIHWEQIGNVLDREEQLNLTMAGHSGGIYAPTLRYHKGTFYMITTNVTHGGNFIVTATDPAGPWSNPHFLKGSEGIDPSLFFDDDGKCYYTGTKDRREGAKFFGDNEVWLQEVDLDTMCFVGESYAIWHGALRGVEWPEGPHLYKKDGYYYLMIAEAGTGHNHAVTIARGTVITELFTGSQGNPILTHRHLGQNYPIVNVGHGDLVETEQGEWWMVVLASRPYGGYYRNLGRETFLVPVTWEDGWPVINYGVGLVEETFTPPNLPEYKVTAIQEKEDFNGHILPYHFIYLRNPKMSSYLLTEREGFLRMKLEPETINETASPTFVGMRQTAMCFITETCMEFEPKNEQECAGLVILQNNAFFYQLTTTLRNSKNTIVLLKCEKGIVNELASAPYDGTKIYLRIEAQEQNMIFTYSTNHKDYIVLKDKVDGRILSTDRAGGFVGTCMGMYCSSNGANSGNYADFDWFLYK